MPEESPELTLKPSETNKPEQRFYIEKADKYPFGYLTFNKFAQQV